MLRDWAMPALVERLRGLLSGSLAAPSVPVRDRVCAVRPAG
jgi:hypothetical protein